MLVIVLWITLGLVALVLLFGQSMKMEYLASANSTYGIESGQALEGARRYLAYTLKNLTTKGVFPDPTLYKYEDVPIGDASFWLIGRSNDQDLSNTDPPAFGFVDEASKLNLNTATLGMLEALPNMTPDLAACIIDWRDADSDPEPNGAESDFYLTGKPPYDCKNAPFESIEELHLVNGFTRDLLFGEDTNLNGIMDPNENDGDAIAPVDNNDGKLTRALLDYVTVYSKEPNTQTDGSARIDVRRANRPQGRDALVQYINQALGGGDRGGQILQAVAGTAPTSVLEFYMRGNVTVDEAAKLEDGLTDHDGQSIAGRVNVNTAPREVLVCIPGIGENFADAVLSGRQGKTADQLNSVRWVGDILDPPSAALAGRYITTRSYQLSADIVAVSPGGRALRRSWIVFDAAGAQPAVLYRSDHTALGWPLGTALREALDQPREASDQQPGLSKDTR